ncbi:hypothetical protein HK096_006534, partial [Nowakowskiella sp. JEL0078]
MTQETHKLTATWFTSTYNPGTYFSNSGTDYSTTGIERLDSLSLSLPSEYDLLDFGDGCSDYGNRTLNIQNNQTVALLFNFRTNNENCNLSSRASRLYRLQSDYSSPLTLISYFPKNETGISQYDSFIWGNQSGVSEAYKSVTYALTDLTFYNRLVYDSADTVGSFTKNTSQLTKTTQLQVRVSSETSMSSLSIYSILSIGVGAILVLTIIPTLLYFVTGFTFRRKVAEVENQIINLVDITSEDGQRLVINVEALPYDTRLRLMRQIRTIREELAQQNKVCLKNEEMDSIEEVTFSEKEFKVKLSVAKIADEEAQDSERDFLDEVPENVCSICIEEFKESEVLKILPGCKHPFDVKCAKAWLSESIFCPLCRRNIRKELGIVVDEEQSTEIGVVENEDENAIPNTHPTAVSEIEEVVAVEKQTDDTVSGLPSTSLMQ